MNSLLNNARTCTLCGANVPRSAPEGICIACLLDSAASNDHSLQTSPPPPTVSGETRYFGDYELIEQAGRGGMGSVYRARQFGTQRIVALKLLAGGALAHHDAIHRFHLEARAAASLVHPRIVPVYECGIHEGQYFLAMPFVPGGTLAAKLKRERYSAERAARIIVDIAEAVAYAHQRGILHRDLKPANILLDDNGQPHVADFGLARVAQEETEITLSGAVLGTAAYMSPEQAAGQPLTVASDIYSLGAILYELLTGRPPFVAPDLPQTFSKILEEDPIRPSHLSLTTYHSPIPLDIETICLKCLEKDPAKRYPTGQALADDLKRFLNNEPISARPITRTAKLVRWAQRNPALATACSLLIILALIILIGSPVAILHINQARKHAEVAKENEQILRRQTHARAYTADMNVALQSWEEGNLKRAQQRLQAYLPAPGCTDLRGFEWYYLWNLCRDDSQYSVTLPPNERSFRLGGSVAHSFVAVAGVEFVQLLDPLTGANIRKLPYPASAERDQSHLVALARGETNALAMHRSGGSVAIWNLASNTCLEFRPFKRRLSTLALSRDGLLMAASDRDHLAMWSLVSNPPTLKWMRPTERTASASCFSPDGRCLVAATKSFLAGTLAAYSVADGHELQDFPKASVGTIHDITFSPDGSLLAASGVQSRINLWNFEQRTVRAVLNEHLGSVSSLDFSPDGRRLISGGSDGTVRLWDVTSGKQLGIFRSPDSEEMNASVYADNGKLVLAGTSRTVSGWTAEPRAMARSLETGQEWGSVSFSPDSKWIVTMEFTVVAKDYNQTRSAQLWDAATLQHKFYLAHTNRQALSPNFSPDGRFFALGGEDRSVGIWETRDWATVRGRCEPKLYLPQEFEAGFISFSPDSKIMAVAGLSYVPSQPSGATNRLAFWATETWQPIPLLDGAGAAGDERNAAAAAVFSPDGRFVAIGHRDGRVRLWALEPAHVVYEFNVPRTDSFGAIPIFSSDGRWLAAHSAGDPVLVLCDVSNADSPHKVFTASAHGGIWSLCFDAQNRSMITMGNDGIIRFWNLEARQIALALRHSHGPGGGMAVSRDGRDLATLDATGLLKLWDGSSELELREGSRAVSNSPRSLHRTYINNTRE